MRTLLLAAGCVAGFSLVATVNAGTADAPAQTRGWISNLAAAPGDGAGTIQFTLRGTNPCSAISMDYGDGTEITHPIRELPVRLSHEYLKAGNYVVRAMGIGNCDGDFTSYVNVTSVRPEQAGDREGRGRGRDSSVTVTVSGRDGWIDTGLDVREGDELQIVANGRIQYGPGTRDTAGPNGAPGYRAPARAPLPRLAIGTLIARVGNSAPFSAVTTGERIPEPVSGRLFLGINDDNLRDNGGEFRVTVTIMNAPGNRGRGRGRGGL